MAVPRSRVLDLMKVQCGIFNTTFNPTAQRLGTKILRQRLKGPATAAYYPRKIGTVEQVAAMYPGWKAFNAFQYDREKKIVEKKARGKGNPKKRSAKPDPTAKKRR